MTTSPLAVSQVLSAESLRNSQSNTSEKHKLALVLPTCHSKFEEAVRIYQSQKRECWLCAKIFSDAKAGKKIQEDDEWHFIACVFSWQHMLEFS